MLNVKWLEGKKPEEESIGEVVGGGVVMGTEAVSFVAGISVFCAHSVVGRHCL